MTALFKTLLAGAAGIVLLGQPAVATAKTQTFGCDPGHTDIRVSWMHAGFSRQSGKFTDFECKLVLDDENPAKSTLTVTIKTNSINTGVPDLDKDLMSENFFDVAKFPEMKFEATGIKKTSATSANVNGKLTIKGITQPVTLDVDLVKKGTHPLGEFFEHYKGEWTGFRAEATVKRSDFKVDKYVPVISDKVIITINTEMKGQ